MDRRDKYLSLVWQICIAMDDLREMEEVYQWLPIMQNRIKMAQMSDKYMKLLEKFQYEYRWDDATETLIEQISKIVQLSKDAYESPALSHKT